MPGHPINLVKTVPPSSPLCLGHHNFDIATSNCTPRSSSQNHALLHNMSASLMHMDPKRWTAPYSVPTMPSLWCRPKEMNIPVQCPYNAISLVQTQRDEHPCSVSLQCRLFGADLPRALEAHPPMRGQLVVQTEHVASRPLEGHRLVRKRRQVGQLDRVGHLFSSACD